MRGGGGGGTRGVMIGGNEREHEEVEGITRGVMIGGNMRRWRV